jgi:hypothetical protein
MKIINNLTIQMIGSIYQIQKTEKHIEYALLSKMGLHFIVVDNN